jgi:hypothetical protein
MIAYRPNTGGKVPGKPALADPGGIDPAQLAQYWRKESAAAAKRMASRLDIRRIAGKYPWLAVWSAEGLATPPASSWTALQQSHLITEEVAALLACDARTIRRYVQNPPEGFPPPVFESGKPWLWRTCQIHAYVTGRPVPRFRRAHPIKAVRASSWDQPPHASTPKAGEDTFNPFCSQ